MKQKLLILWLMLLAGASGLRAAEAYAVRSTDSKTLTFYYDNARSSRTGTAYDITTVFNPFTETEHMGWYSYASSVTSVVFDSSFANARPGSCTCWFEGMSNLVSITGISYLNTSNVSEMNDMFRGCENLTTIDVSGFDTGNVQLMGGMFRGCTSLSNLDVSGFDTSSAIYMAYMFEGCENLTTIDVSNWQVHQCFTDYMFSGCKKLRNLDLSSFVFRDESDFTSIKMMLNCIGLKSLKVPASANNLDANACSGVGTQSAPCTLVYPAGFTPQKTATGDGWYKWKSGYFKDVVSEPYAVLSTDNKTLTFYYDKLRASRPGTTYDMNTGSNFPVWFINGNYHTITRVVFDPSFANARPTSCYYWFCYMTELTSISGLNYLNTSGVTDMEGMFALCSSLTSLDVSGFNTSNVREMDFMFRGCSGLESLDLGGFILNVNSVTTSGLLKECSGLKTLVIPASASRFASNACEGVGTQNAPCALIYPDGFTPETTATGDGWHQWKKGYFKDGVLEPYTVLSTDGTTLTFCYDAHRSSRTGTTYDLNKPYYYSSPEWKAQADGITTVVFNSSFANARPVSCYEWFRGMTNLTSIQGLNYLNTSEVVSMFTMFDGCSSLTNLDVSGFNTSKVYDMTSMFSDCSSLESLDVSGFNTENVTKIYCMFDGCSSLTNLDVSGFNTSKVTDMLRMFCDCSSLESLDVSGFNTENVTNMCYMFYGCKSLENLDVSGFNTSKVTDMYSMFNDCSSIKSLDLSGFNTENVTDMSRMFTGCKSLTNLDVSGLNTENVTDMKLMFYFCLGLENLNLSNFTFKSDTETRGMLEDCRSLKTLTIPATASYLDADACEDVGTQAAPCALIYPEDFTPETTATGDGWYQWKSGYFKDVVLEPYAVLTADTLTFYYDDQRSSRIGTTYDLNTGTSRPGWYVNRSSINNVVFDLSFATARPTNCYQWFYAMGNLTSITGLKFLNTSKVTNMASMFSSCSQLSNIDVSHFNTSQVVDMSGMFESCAITSIDVSNFNTSNVTNMMGMFVNDASLDSLDISNFVIPDSTLYYGYATHLMFANCTSLKTLAIPATAKNIKHTSCTGVGTQANPCTLIYPPGFILETTATGDGWYQWKSGYFKDIDPQPYAELSEDSTTLTFYYDRLKTSRTGTTYDLNTGTNRPGWYFYDNPVTSVVFDSSFADARPTSCSYWFISMENLTSITGMQYLNTSEVTSMEGMFYNCPSLTNVDLSNFDTSKVTSMAFMFLSCPGLTSVDVSHFNTANVEDMWGMFRECTNLTYVDVSNFNTDKVWDMGYMFDGCHSLESVDVSHFNTANVTDMENMFNGCSNLASVDVSNFNTAKVTYMGYMFNGCSNLASVDVSNFNTNSVKDMSWMFAGCSKLTNLDLSSFYIPDDYYHTPYLFGDEVLYGSTGMLNGCTMLKALSVSAMANKMYEDVCLGVGTQANPCTLIYPEGFTPETTATGDGWYKWKSGYFKDAVPEPYAVLSKDETTLTFYYDNKRATRKGTTYDMNTGKNNPGWCSINNSIAKVVFDSSFADARPTSCYYWFWRAKLENMEDIEGIQYLNTSMVTNMSHMFFECTKLTSINVSSFNTAKVTDMSYMFAYCSKLTSLDVSNFDTGRVTDMSYMFGECSSLTSLLLGNFNTAKVKTMANMFKNCTELTSLDVSKFNTAIVTSMSYMFYNCKGLTSLDVSKFNTAKVTNMNYMFTNCSNLSSLDLSNFTFKENLTSIVFLRNASGLEELIISATAGNLNANACEGVGTQESPCTLIYPSVFTPEATEMGNGWYIWKSGYFKDAVVEPYAVFDDNTLTFYYDAKAQIRSGTVYELNEGDGEPGWREHFYDITTVVFDATFSDARPTTCAYWFYNLFKLTDIEGLGNLVTTDVTNMWYMFGSCVKLKSLDVSTFNTDEVTEMSYMFYDCSSLESLTGLSSFNTSKVTDMVGMFKDCTSLTDLDLDGFNTTNVYSTAGMFNNCTSLTTLDLHNFTILQHDTEEMLMGCTSLQHLILPATANRLAANACSGVGTANNPCILTYPQSITLEGATQYDDYFIWRSGYFCDEVSFLLGDVNHDGGVTITDVTLTVDYVLGKHPSPFYIENADVASDGVITVSDVTAIVNLVLNNNASHAPATARNANFDRLWLSANGSHCLLHLDTPERYTAMHLTLRLPEGASMGNVSIASARSAGHSISSRAIGEDLYNIVLFANDNAELRSDATELLHFDIAGCQPRDVEVVAVQSTNRLFETIMSSGITTGIDIVETDDATDGDSYNTVGVRVNKNARGVVIKNGSKKIEN